MQDVAAAGSPVESVTTFLTAMGALSTAVQQLVEHVLKKRIDWLDVAKPHDKTHEARRASAVHGLSFLIGAALCYSAGMKPLAYLGAASAGGPLVNALLAGIMVSFGSSFFDEALGAIREFKKAQATLGSRD
jgi:hypothetical protein